MAWWLSNDKIFDAIFEHCSGILYMKEAEDRDKNLIGSVGDGSTIQRYKNVGGQKKFFLRVLSEILKIFALSLLVFSNNVVLFLPPSTI